MVTSMGLPGAARSQEEVADPALGGVGEIKGVAASVGVVDGVGLAVPAWVGVTGVSVGVIATASVRRAWTVW
jgi:hypothetical protein